MENANEETGEHEIESQTGQVNTQREPNPLRRKRTAKRSKAWNHYSMFSNSEGKLRARCIHCGKDYAAESSKNGTSTLRNHVKLCKKNLTNVGDNDQTMDSGGSRSLLKVDQEFLRMKLSHMLIVDELPFKFVENEGFRDFMEAALPQFVIPSRTTVTRDCLRLYLDQKKTLKSYLRKLNKSRRICLTTDTWTSNQKITYLCLTGHFIDDSWKLKKLILNFVPCPSHKGDEVGLLIEKCLIQWGIDEVFTITVDNASSNDTTVAYLRRRFASWKKDLLNGKYLHMRCVAHIINLVVKDGLKEVHQSVDRVRTVVRYIRQSPTRWKKFKTFVEEEKVESKKLLCLDVATRWNSVYFMLETVVIFQDVFDRYEMADAEFRNDFLPGGAHGSMGLPRYTDWIIVERLVKVLKHFYDVTCHVSGSKLVTSNVFLDEIGDIDTMIKEWLTSNDMELANIASKMKLKFDKYWGDPEKMNMMFFVAAMVDPRYKMKYVLFNLQEMYEGDLGETICSLARKAFVDMFEEYKKLYAPRPSPSCMPSSSSRTTTRSPMLSEFAIESNSEKRAARAFRKNKYRRFNGDDDTREKSELDKYLLEKEETDTEDFDVLEWWKFNAPRFPVLSRLARDLLAMPISTVASESAFSIGGRVIDDFRSSLTPKAIQALICAQDWRRTIPPEAVEEEFEVIDMIVEDEFSRNDDSEASMMP